MTGEQVCGQRNALLGLTCNRKPHTDGAHMLIDHAGVHAWPGRDTPTTTGTSEEQA